MPVLWSPDMKNQHEASSSGLEKRLKFLDEFKRISEQPAGELEEHAEEGAAEDTQGVSPSNEFFLVK
jgi:hypothetical protein